MDRNNPDLPELIEKLQNGSITPEEEQFLLDWYEQLDTAGQPVWQSSGQEARTRRTLRHSIELALSQKGILRLKPRYQKALWRVAASIVILFSAWCLQRAINPGKGQNNFATTWTFISNDSTSCKKIQLPDGSVVWLNTASHLRYNDRFGKDNRLVYADGELLLDVEHNNSQPFKVITGDVTTTVMGTLLNVEAYTDETEIKVSLLRGKIRISDSAGSEKILLPGQMAISRKGGALKVSANDNIHTDEWIHGGLVFNETLLADALHRMERKYKVSFDYPAGMLKEQRITSVILEEDHWKTALAAMLFIHNIHFKQTNNIIHLYR